MHHVYSYILEQHIDYPQVLFHFSLMPKYNLIVNQSSSNIYLHFQVESLRPILIVLEDY